jgi:hypothetical protein
MASEVDAKRKCSGEDCDNDAGSLQCPTCLKLGIKDSFFCSQDCFKRNWVCSTICLSPQILLPYSKLPTHLEDFIIFNPTYRESRLTVISRAHTKLYIKHRVTLSVISSPQMRSLNQVQTAASSTLSLPFPIPAPCGPSTLSQNVERYRNP